MKIVLNSPAMGATTYLTSTLYLRVLNEKMRHFCAKFNLKTKKQVEAKLNNSELWCFEPFKDLTEQAEKRARTAAESKSREEEEKEEDISMDAVYAIHRGDGFDIGVRIEKGCGKCYAASSMQIGGPTILWLNYLFDLKTEDLMFTLQTSASDLSS
jgi:hypothetical protein